MAAAQSTQFTGIVAPSKTLQFTVHVSKVDKTREDEVGVIDWIEIRKAGALVQTIRFADDDAPIAYPRDGLVSLKDVDCDGYKDLLARSTVGIHGDAWYRLYRFDHAEGRFIFYPRFSHLPFKRVDCRTKLVTTYVNSGSAGCAYERGLYRWLDHELVPVRIEEQTPVSSGRFTRTIRVWRNGKDSTRKTDISAGDCH